MTRVRALSAAVLVAAGGGVGALVHSTATAQPKRGVDVVRELSVPAGTYSAFVITAYGTPDKRSWSVVLETDAGRFPISVEGGSSRIVPFESGWTLARDARLIISPDAPTYLVTAWGIGKGGPVVFPQR